MEKIKIDCLTDCIALCCKHNNSIRISFEFSDIEVEMMNQAGAKLIPSQEGHGLYYMSHNCPFLTEKDTCSLHDTSQQPKCCRDNLAGKFDICQTLRNFHINGKRYSEVE